jgi:hypothetical protein
MDAAAKSSLSPFGSALTFPETHVWQLRPRRQPNAGLGAEHQPIIRDSAQDVTLALGVRLRLANSSIEQAKSCGKIANDARGLQLQVIERPESLQPRAALLPPPMSHAHAPTRGKDRRFKDPMSPWGQRKCGGG